MLAKKWSSPIVLPLRIPNLPLNGILPRMREGRIGSRLVASTKRGGNVQLSKTMNGRQLSATAKEDVIALTATTRGGGAMEVLRGQDMARLVARIGPA